MTKLGDNIQEARAALEVEAARNLEACNQELDALLKRRNCELIAFVTIENQQIPVPVLLRAKVY